MKPEIATHRTCPRCHRSRPWHHVHPDHGCLACTGLYERPATGDER